MGSGTAHVGRNGLSHRPGAVETAILAPAARGPILRPEHREAGMRAGAGKAWLAGAAAACWLATAAPPAAAAPPVSCARQPGPACLPSLPAALAKRLARNGPALRNLLGWLAYNEGYYEPNEWPGQASDARTDAVLRQFADDEIGGDTGPGPVSLDRLERLLDELAHGAARRGEFVTASAPAMPWLLLCRSGTTWPLARTRMPATRPCVSLSLAPWGHWLAQSGDKRERAADLGLLDIVIGDFTAPSQDPSHAPPGPLHHRHAVTLALTHGGTVATSGKPKPEESGVDLPYESEDWGVEPTATLRADDIHAPTPARIPGAQVISTGALLEMLLAEGPRPLVIDVVPTRWRRTLPTAFQLPNAGMLATQAKNGAQAVEINATLERRLSLLLAEETGGDRSKPVVFLCVSVDCWLSYNAALRAVAAGYTQVLWYRGGTAAWRAAGIPWHPPRRVQFPGGPADWEVD